MSKENFYFCVGKKLYLNQSKISRYYLCMEKTHAPMKMFYFLLNYVQNKCFTVDTMRQFNILHFIQGLQEGQYT